MRKHNLNYVVIGVFVSAMLAALTVAVVLVGGGGATGESYSIVFNNVADVKYGTQVRFEGYPVGQVEGIAPFSDAGGTRFRIAVTVAEGWQIPADSIARVGSSSFLGARTIDIERGESDFMLKPGGQMSSAPSTDIFSAITRVADEISDVNQELVRPLLVDLSETVRVVGDELEAFSRGLNENMVAVRQILSPTNVAAIDTMLADFTAIGASVKETSRNAAALVARVDGLVARVDDLIRENSANVSSGLEDFRYILNSVAENIDTINHNLDGATRNLNEFARQIRNNPGLLLGGSPRKEVRNGGGENRAGRGGATQSGELR